MARGGPIEHDRRERRDAPIEARARPRIAHHAPVGALLRKLHDADAHARVQRLPMRRRERRARREAGIGERGLDIFVIDAHQPTRVWRLRGEQRHHVRVLAEALFLFGAGERVGIEVRRDGVEQRVAPGDQRAPMIAARMRNRVVMRRADGRERKRARRLRGRGGQREQRQARQSAKQAAPRHARRDHILYVRRDIYVLGHAGSLAFQPENP